MEIIDKDGSLVPDADNLVQFDVRDCCFVAGVDNGSQTNMEPFKASQRKTFNGKPWSFSKTMKSAAKRHWPQHQKDSSQPLRPSGLDKQNSAKSIALSYKTRTIILFNFHCFSLSLAGRNDE